MSFNPNLSVPAQWAKANSYKQVVLGKLDLEFTGSLPAPCRIGAACDCKLIVHTLIYHVHVPCCSLVNECHLGIRESYGE